MGLCLSQKRTESGTWKGPRATKLAGLLKDSRGNWVIVVNTYTSLVGFAGFDCIYSAKQEAIQMSSLGSRVRKYASRGGKKHEDKNTW